MGMGLPHPLQLVNIYKLCGAIVTFTFYNPGPGANKASNIQFLRANEVCEAAPSVQWRGPGKFSANDGSPTISDFVTYCTTSIRFKFKALEIGVRDSRA